MMVIPRGPRGFAAASAFLARSRSGPSPGAPKGNKNAIKQGRYCGDSLSQFDFSVQFEMPSQTPDRKDIAV
jgi:hypothetical protein